MIPGRIYVDNKLPIDLVFYCKDCRKIVETTPVGKKFVYTCNICKTKNVAFGTLKSIKNFYRVTESELPAAAVAPVDPLAPTPAPAAAPASGVEKKALNADKL